MAPLKPGSGLSGWPGPNFNSIVPGDPVLNVGVQASHVAVNSHGVAYLAWERFTPTAIENESDSLEPQRHRSALSAG